MLTQAKDVYIVPGDSGGHQLLNTTFWDELQQSSVEAAQASATNFWSFSENCLFFAVIYKNVVPEPAEDEVLEEQEDPEEYDEFGIPIYPTTPPAGDFFTSDLHSEGPNLDQSPWTRRAVNQITPSLSTIPYNSLFDKQLRQLKLRNPEQQKKPVPVVIGVVFLTSSPQENAPAGEGNIGAFIVPEWRGSGYARQAIELVMHWAFEEIGFHRVQARVLNSPWKGKVTNIFMQLGFCHEGTRRRSIYSARDGSWKDATYFAMLDTEWMMRGYLKPAPKSLWDEMFLRHSREREEHLQWEERCAKLNRTASMETIREMSIGESQAGSDVASECELSLDPYANDKGKQKEDDHSSISSSPFSTHSELFYDAGSGSPTSIRHTPTAWPRLQPRRSRGVSSASSVQSSESDLPVAPGTPASSQWELLEQSDSSSGFSSIGHSDMDSDFE